MRCASSSSAPAGLRTLALALETAPDNPETGLARNGCARCRRATRGRPLTLAWRVTFTGIPLAALDFYEDLEADNTKSFWTAHKHIYDESVKAPLEALADELETEFGTPKFFRPVP